MQILLRLRVMAACWLLKHEFFPLLTMSPNSLRNFAPITTVWRLKNSIHCKNFNDDPMKVCRRHTRRCGGWLMWPRGSQRPKLSILVWDPWKGSEVTNVRHSFHPTYLTHVGIGFPSIWTHWAQHGQRETLKPFPGSSTQQSCGQALKTTP